MGRQSEQAGLARFSRRWHCALVAVLSIVFAACTPGTASLAAVFTELVGRNPQVLGPEPDQLLR